MHISPRTIAVYYDAVYIRRGMDMKMQMQLKGDGPWRTTRYFNCASRFAPLCWPIYVRGTIASPVFSVF